VKDRDVRDAADGSDDLGTLVLLHYRPARTFERTHRIIAVDADDENVRHLRRSLEISHMTDVENVEDAVGKSDGVTRRSFFCDDPRQVRLAQYRRVHRSTVNG
jgi:hypothetical protein